MTRTAKAPEERRQEILDTALELFLKNGYEGTAISDIVQKLSVSQGLFYYYFESKDEVFEAAMEQFADEFAAKLAAMITNSSLSILQRMELIISSMNTMFSASSGLVREDIEPATRLDTDYRLSIRIIQLLIEPISRVFEETNEQGKTAIENTIATASFLGFGLFGLIHGHPEKGPYGHHLELESIMGMIAGVLGVDLAELMEL